MTIHETRPEAEPEAKAPEMRYYEGPASLVGDVGIHQRVFSHQTAAGVLAGVEVSVMFSVERPARVVWAQLKDFNRWQNSYGYYYSGVVGELYTDESRDLGNQSFRIAINKPNKPREDYPYAYRVLKVIPERLIVLFQPVPEDGGNGGVSPGFHVFMLNEHCGKTLVTIHMEHASRRREVTEDEALDPWRKMMPEYERFWRDIFIPNLKRLVDDDT